MTTSQRGLSFGTYAFALAVALSPAALQADTFQCELFVRYPCTEQGIRDAIAAGGGPHRFDCDGPTTVLIGQTIGIDRDVNLDGEGNLTIESADRFNPTLAVHAKARLRRLNVNGINLGGGDVDRGAIVNRGTLTLTDSTVMSRCSDEPWGVLVCANGIVNWGTLTLINSTVISGDLNTYGAAVRTAGNLEVLNSTLAGPLVIGITYACDSRICNCAYDGEVSLWASTIVGAVEFHCTGGPPGVIANSLVQGTCYVDNYRYPAEPWASGSYNIESPGDTCGFDQSTDQVNVSTEDLALGPLADNGGATMTHGLGGDSAAIDAIPSDSCVVPTDQRGEPRGSGEGCDVGAFEAQCLHDFHCKTVPPMYSCRYGVCVYDPQW
jgi:hypothetical protein